MTSIKQANKELLILRHGKSDWDATTDDFDRPLVERGKRGAELLGVWVEQQNLCPDFILSSPATRAIETARRFCKAMGFNERHIYQDARIYEANGATLKAILNECPSQAQRVLLVGHNPGLEHLLEDLLIQPAPIAADGKLLPTATLAHLTLAQYWSQTGSHCAQLNSLTRASSLAEQFPFISLNGAEFRPRPAYYYAQSGVIPYSIVDGELKLLLISSDSKNRWNFPKGIIEPGLSPQASAAKEAWEEAGLKGVVGDQALGCYSREKWQGLCTIQVFPMAVTEMVATHEWEENHRHRQWLPPKQAIIELNQPELTKIIKRLLTLLADYPEVKK
jgi:phosphohistidine phosphatase